MKNHLIVDENARDTVRLIFDLALQGLGVRRIRLYLIEHKVLKPAAYLVRNGAKGLDRLIEKGEYNWVDNSVRSILRSPIYAGNIVSHKRVPISIKSKKRLSRKPEEWEIVYNTHEGIVTQEEFDQVQKMMNSRRAPENKDNFDNIFNGIIKCADCGYALTKLYEDKVLEHITEYNYLKMSEKYQNEQNEIMEKLKTIENKIIEEEKSSKGAVDFVNLIKDYKGIEKLDRKILNSLIERIEVSEK